MGGFTALHLAMQHPDRLLSAVAAGAGYGAQPERQEQEPDAFNREVDRFLAAVDRGAWRRRDPRSLSASTTGMSS